MTDKFEQKAREMLSAIANDYGMAIEDEDTTLRIIAEALRAAHDEAIDEAIATVEAIQADVACELYNEVHRLKHAKESA